MQRSKSISADSASSFISRTRAAPNTLVISDSSSLQTWLRQLRSFTRTRGLPLIVFQLPEFSYEQNRSLSALAAGYQNACGCTSGSFFTSATVVGVVISYFVSGGHLSGISLSHVLRFLGITALAALIGKLFGLGWARWRLLRLATNIHNSHRAVS